MGWATPPPAIDTALSCGNASLIGTVVVGIRRNAKFPGGLDKGICQWVLPIQFCHLKGDRYLPRNTEFPVP